MTKMAITNIIRRFCIRLFLRVASDYLYRFRLKRCLNSHRTCSTMLDNYSNCNSYLTPGSWEIQVCIIIAIWIHQISSKSIKNQSTNPTQNNNNNVDSDYGFICM